VSDMPSQAADLARCLARDAEAVCRRYLSNGRRRGRYWVVGDVANTPGRSLFVRLTGPDSGKGAAGKWTDAATGQHGDLLDLIALKLGLERLRDVLDEARSFLSLPPPQPTANRCAPQPSAPIRSPASARRLFAMAQPISGTIAETYLRKRGITALHDRRALSQPPRNHSLRGNATTALCRVRQRPSWRPGGGDLDRPGAGRRDRGAHVVADAGRFQRRPPPSGRGSSSNSLARPACPARRASIPEIDGRGRNGAMKCAARPPACRSHRFTGDAPLPERAALAAFKRAIGRQVARVRNGGRRLFSAAGRNPALHREAK
jgi:hypothetical protein